jgi:hypothetical protein
MALQPITPQKGAKLLKSTSDKSLDTQSGTSVQSVSSYYNLERSAKPNLRAVEWLNFFGRCSNRPRAIPRSVPCGKFVESE